MINEDTIAAFNSRQTVNLNSVKTMKPSEMDRVKSWGTSAENLMLNKDLALFIHQYKFTVCDQQSDIKGHSVDDNAKRIALSNHIQAIDQFIALLKEAVYYKNRIVSQQSQNPSEPAPIDP